MVLRYREYFGKEGGITLSGGEPLLQPDFAREIFTLCHENGINTCLDTSGSILNDSVKALLAETDRVLLDIKYTSDELYRENVGCTLQSALDFLGYLNESHIPVTIRQVIIPTVNDDRENMLKLKEIVSRYPCVDKVELLPFRKICQTKYDNMKLVFPFGHLPAATKAATEELHKILEE
jgi:pyruvate formate lyase activating enzyme